MSMNPKDEDSEVMFGNWNTALMDDSYNGEPEWHPVEHQLFWSIALEDIKIGDKSLGLCGFETDDSGEKKAKCLVTPDTGTSLLTFPKWAKT